MIKELEYISFFRPNFPGMKGLIRVSMSNVCYLAKILIFFDFLGGYLVVTARYLLVIAGDCLLPGGYLVVTACYLLVTAGYCLLPGGYCSFPLLV